MTAIVASACLSTPTAAIANRITVENAQPGDSYWSQVTTNGPPGGTIEGYTGTTGVEPGQTIDLHVNVPSGARYRIMIERLGWYGGAGGRRLGCLVGTAFANSCSADEAGIAQPATPPADPATGLVAAHWSVTDRLAVPTSWVPGYYLAIFQLTSGHYTGKVNFTPFIVEDPPTTRTDVLVQVPVNTWQAYNSWGAESLYGSSPAVKVSFDRPYDYRQLFNWELPMLRFLEREGYDVSYATDDAVNDHPDRLLYHSVDIVAGHGEYWTTAMRDGWEAARDHGVNEIFAGANESYWHIRYEDAGRTIVSYKLKPDPDPNPLEVTTQFRDLPNPRPECQLVGVAYALNSERSNLASLDYMVTSTGATDPWLASAGLQAGAVLAGYVGYEFDSLVRGCHTPPEKVLFSYAGPAGTADAVRVTACSGAEIFSAGSLEFSWGLDSYRDPSLGNNTAPADSRIQAFMRNVMNDMLVSHIPISGPPTVCVPSPTFSVMPSEPLVRQQVTVTSTATDTYGTLKSIGWQLPGQASCTQGRPQSRTWSSNLPGVFPVALCAIDTSGASASKTELIHVAAPPATGCGSRVLYTERLSSNRREITFYPAGRVHTLRVNGNVLFLRHRKINFLHTIFQSSATNLLWPGPKGAGGLPSAGAVLLAVTGQIGAVLRTEFYIASTSVRKTILGLYPTSGTDCGSVISAHVRRIAVPRQHGSFAVALRLRHAATLHLVLATRTGHVVEAASVRVHRGRSVVTLRPRRRLTRGLYAISIRGGGAAIKLGAFAL